MPWNWIISKFSFIYPFLPTNSPSFQKLDYILNQSFEFYFRTVAHHLKQMLWLPPYRRKSCGSPRFLFIGLLCDRDNKQKSPKSLQDYVFPDSFFHSLSPSTLFGFYLQIGTYTTSWTECSLFSSLVVGYWFVPCVLVHFSNSSRDLLS